MKKPSNCIVILPALICSGCCTSEGDIHWS